MKALVLAWLSRPSRPLHRDFSRKSISTTILLILVLALAFVPFARAQGSVVATLAVGAGPWGAAYDPARGEVFVTNHGSTTVSVISDSSNLVLATVSVESAPLGVAYDLAKGEILVANANSSSISVISDTSNKVVANVSDFSPPGIEELNPEGVAYDPAKGEIFVANAGSGTVSVISDTYNRVIATPIVGQNPNGIAYDPNAGNIFVANYDDNTVSVISDANNSVVATVSVGAGPEQLAYDSVRMEMFVTNTISDSVSIISDRDYTVVATLPVGSDPNGITYDSSKGEMFVADYGGDTVSVISDSNDGVSTVSVGSEPAGVAYDSGKGEVFVTDHGSDAVSVISDASTPFDFSLAIAPTTQSVGPGQDFNATVSVGRVNATSGMVTLSVTGPAGTAPPAEMPLNGTAPFVAALTGVAPIVPGVYVFTVTGRAGDITHSANLTITVLPPSIVLSSTSGAPGSSVTVTGKDFLPLSSISITMGQTSLGTVMSTAQGTFVASFIVPRAAAGNYMVTAASSPSIGAAQSFAVKPAPPPSFPWVKVAEFAAVSIVVVVAVGGGFLAIRQSRTQLRPNDPKFTVTVTVTSSAMERRKKPQK